MSRVGYHIYGEEIHQKRYQEKNTAEQQNPLWRCSVDERGRSELNILIVSAPMNASCQNPFLQAKVVRRIDVTGGYDLMNPTSHPLLFIRLQF